MRTILPDCATFWFNSSMFLLYAGCRVPVAEACLRLLLMGFAEAADGTMWETECSVDGFGPDSAALVCVLLFQGPLLDNTIIPPLAISQLCDGVCVLYV